MKQDRDYGHVELCITEYLQQHRISKNTLEEKANVGRTQLLNYCNNKTQRIDLAVISRICHALDCDLSDIVRYIPPNTKPK